MPALIHLEEFKDIVERSGLVARPQLEAYFKKTIAAGDPTVTPTSLADQMVRDGLLTSFQAQKLLAGKNQGFVILGKYKIMEIIGIGGMGKVFLCDHIMLHRQVAVKVLTKSKTNDTLAIERFYREARAVAALDHPNIVRCFDIDREGVFHFMVMEYVDGANLGDFVKRNGPLDILRACHYMRQVAEGLQHAHENGWVHRDIKPANLLLDRSGLVKILDLGLARLFTNQVESLTQQHNERAILGTADYIAPEQAVGSQDVDIRADIYSLGCTFYFLLTGKAPFHDGTLAQKLVWHQMRTPVSLTESRSDVPAVLIAIIDRMLAKKPEDRYQVPSQLVSALAPWTAKPIPAPTPDQLVRTVYTSYTGTGSRSNYSASDVWNPMGDESGTNMATTRKSEAARLDDATLSARTGNTPSSSIGRSRTRLTDDSDSRAGRSGISSPLSSANPRQPKTNRATETSTGSKPSSTPAKGNSSIRNIALLAGVVILTAAALYGFLGKRRDETQAAAQQTTTPQPPPVAVKLPSGLLVTHNRRSEAWGKPNTFESVAKAIAHASSGDHILILDQTYEERLVLDDEKHTLAKNLVVESYLPGGKPTKWVLPADIAENVPLVTLSRVESCTFKNIHFDVEGRADYLVALAGSCPGLRFESLTLNGFKKAAISFTDCLASAETPIVLNDSRTTARDAEAALVFITKNGKAGGNEHIRIEGCRFEGPYKTTVSIDSPVASVDFRHNRFYRADTAFEYRTSGPAHRLRLSLADNTFCETRTLLTLRTLPSLGANGSRIDIVGNLLASTSQALSADPVVSNDQAKTLFQNCKFNICDQASVKESFSFLPMRRLRFELATDPADEASFLRYPKNSTLAESGPDGGPVGVPPK